MNPPQRPPRLATKLVRKLLRHRVGGANGVRRDAGRIVMQLFAEASVLSLLAAFTGLGLDLSH